MNYQPAATWLLASIATFSYPISIAKAQVINQDLKISSNDANVDDHFGHDVSIDGGLIVASSIFDDDLGSASGSAYIIDSTSGTILHKLLPNDGQAEDLFGQSVDIDDSWVVIGAGEHDNRGAVYVYDSATGSQIYKLEGTDIFDAFGYSVAIDAGIITVGSFGDDDNGSVSGSAYLFDAATGTQLHKLVPLDGEAQERFGSSVAISGNTVVVGAPFDNQNGHWSGAAYIFNATTGVQIAKLVANDGADDDFFGTAVAIGDGVVCVGAYKDGDQGYSSGSVYLYDAQTGTQLMKILASDGSALTNFGGDVAIDNDILAVGAWGANIGSTLSPGAVYLYDLNTGNEIAKLIASDGAQSDFLGTSVAIQNETVVTGAILADSPLSNQGSIYLFSVPNETCPADLTNDGNLNFFDVSAFLSAFAANDPDADFTNDGLYNFFDVSAFLNAFAAGCP